MRGSLVIAWYSAGSSTPAAPAIACSDRDGRRVDAAMTRFAVVSPMRFAFFSRSS